MNAILGLNDLLQTELADRHEDVQLAELIRNSTEQLLSLINDILLLSQLEAQRVNLHPAPSNVRQLLNEVREQWQGVSESKGLVLDVRTQNTVPQWLTLDGPRFKQVLGQLLNNALKYTNQGHVELGLAYRDGQMQVWVADTGEGITPEQQRIIFNRFEQADTRTNRGQGGTGIGLAICKHVVELAGGHIQVVSEPGQGARFDITWPAPVAVMPDDQTHMQNLATQAPRCLVVDDHPLNLKVTVMGLRQSWPQAEIHTADGGRAALAWLSQHPVDVVLLDRIMPDFDGLQTVQAIRNHAQAEVRHLTVLGLTGLDDEAERTACLRAGMDDVLIKPVLASTLKSHIQAALAKRRLQQCRPVGAA
jgi:CheY-like chemotaxis protein